MFGTFIRFFVRLIINKMQRNSFDGIYTSYYKKSYFFAKSYVHNDFAAEDIASEALIKLWEKLKKEEIEEKYVLPLLVTILKNKALDYLKHEEVKRTAFEVMADWQQQEYSIRMAGLMACNPEEISTCTVATSQSSGHFEFDVPGLNPMLQLSVYSCSSYDSQCPATLG